MPALLLPPLWSLAPRHRQVQPESPPLSSPNSSYALSMDMRFITLPFSTPFPSHPACKSCSGSTCLFILQGWNKQVTYWCFKSTFTLGKVAALLPFAVHPGHPRCRAHANQHQHK